MKSEQLLSSGIDKNFIQEYDYQRNYIESHQCYRHWAFTLFKYNELAKSIQKIKEAVEINAQDPHNWIVWGLVMKKIGSYSSAMHQFKMAQKLDPKRATASEKITILEKIIQLDSQISLEKE